MRLPRKSTALEEKAASNPLDRKFSDLVGTMKQQSLGRVRYFVRLLGLCSGYSLFRSTHRKNEAGDAVVEMIRELLGLSQSQVKSMTSVDRNIFRWTRTDGAGGYVGKEFRY